MKFSSAVGLLLSVALASIASAQTSINQKLTSAGVTALSSPSGGAAITDDLFTKPAKETDHEVGTVVPNAALTVPGPAAQGAPAVLSNAIGFNGISHFDQRTAGRDSTSRRHTPSQAGHVRLSAARSLHWESTGSHPASLKIGGRGDTCGQVRSAPPRCEV